MQETLQFHVSKAILKNNRNYIKPNEDFLVCDIAKNIFLVLDGVSRDKENGVYPVPSPSSIVSKCFADSFFDYFISYGTEDILDSLKRSISYANSKIRDLNTQNNILWDFLPGVVGIILIIKNDVAFFAYLGDCIGRISNGKICNVFTESQTRLIQIHKAKYSASEIRNEICNNIYHPHSYGVYTGQEEALNFVRYGNIKIKSGISIIISSDGLNYYLDNQPISDVFSKNAEQIIQEALVLETENNFQSDDKAIIKIDVV
jgi:hypothetical protein